MTLAELDGLIGTIAGIAIAIVGWVSRRVLRESIVQNELLATRFRLMVEEAVAKLDREGSQQVPVLESKIDRNGDLLTLLREDLKGVQAMLHDHENSPFPHSHHHQ